MEKSPIPFTERKAFTTDEVGLIVGVTPGTVRRWTRLGLLPSFKLQGPWSITYVPASTVQALFLELQLGNPLPVALAEVRKHSWTTEPKAGVETPAALVESVS